MCASILSDWTPSASGRFLLREHILLYILHEQLTCVGCSWPHLWGKTLQTLLVWLASIKSDLEAITAAIQQQRQARCVNITSPSWNMLLFCFLSKTRSGSVSMHKPLPPIINQKWKDLISQFVYLIIWAICFSKSSPLIPEPLKEERWN